MKLDVWDVSVRVSVPAGMNKATVQKMLNQMLGEAESRCDDYLRQDPIYVDSDIIESAKIIKKSEFLVCDPEFECSEGTDLDCSVDVGEATYIGDGNDGVYYQVFADENDQFWMSALVDSDYGRFVDSLVESDGPYDSPEDAELAGRDAAMEWCGWNNVSYSDN